MVQMLYSVGPAHPGTGFGLVPITWTDIKSWAELLDIQLHPWQAEALVSMSNGYAAEFNSASGDEPRLPPWVNETRHDAIGARATNALRRGFRAMIDKKAKRDG